MDREALRLLERVGRTYAELWSLSLDVSVTTGGSQYRQGMEGFWRAVFAAPDLVRAESDSVKRGAVLVADGEY